MGEMELDWQTLASDEAATREEMQPRGTEAVRSDRKEDGSLLAALASSPLDELPLPLV